MGSPFKNTVYLFYTDVYFYFYIVSYTDVELWGRQYQWYYFITGQMCSSRSGTYTDVQLWSLQYLWYYVIRAALQDHLQNHLGNKMTKDQIILIVIPLIRIKKTRTNQRRANAVKITADVLEDIWTSLQLLTKWMILGFIVKQFDLMNILDIFCLLAN